MNITLDSAFFNKVYMPYINCHKRMQIYYGGAGSGKSVFCAQKTVMHCLTTTYRSLVIRKYGNTNRNSTFVEIKNIINQWLLNHLFRIRLSDMVITCIQSGGLIIFTGLDDVLKIKSISNIRMMWVLLASEISKDDYLQLNLRMRGGGDGNAIFQMLLSFNPISKSHWIANFFFNKGKPIKSCHLTNPETMLVVHTTYLDNLFLDDGYIELLESYKNISPYHYQVYTLGLWGDVGLVVLTNWLVKHLDIQHLLNTADYIVAGLDYGFNDPTAAVLVAIKDSNLYILREYYHRKKTNEDVAIDLINDVYFRNTKIYADSALPARILLMKRRGLYIVPVVKKSIKLTINLLKLRKIIIHDECNNLINLLQNYQYVKDRKTGEYIDLILPGNDHAIDALRYATMLIMMNANRQAKIVGM